MPRASLTRREFARLAAAGLAAPRMLSGLSVDATPPARAWPRYARVPVIDLLANPGPFNTPERVDALTPEMVRNAAASGITAVNISLSASTTVEDTARSIGFWERERAAHPDVLASVRSVRDLRAAKDSRRLGLIYGFQDSAVIGEDLTRVRMFHDLGVRIIQLTYNLRNLAGDGCLEPGNAGLSRLGRELVGELNARRIVVDLSHCGQRTTADGIAASARPVAITHSGCAALADRPRNKRDAELRAMADKGGVVGIYLMPFLTMGAQPMADDVVRHIEHAVKVCGEDHVGIGSDLSITPHEVTDAYRKTHRAFVEMRQRRGIAAPGEDPEVFMFVPDLNTPRRMEQIADRLLARGHPEARVEKIVGGNWMRLLGEVWGG